MKKILILTGGPVKKIEEFEVASQGLDLELSLASFKDVRYDNLSEGFEVFIGDDSLNKFDVVYFRLVGRRLEDATIVANYAKKAGIRIVDRLYQNELLYPSSISKAHETMKMIEKNIPMPKTIYGDLSYLYEVAPKVFSYPFVFKTTTGKKAREVWAPKNKENMDEMYEVLREFEKSGSRFFAQEFMHASQRFRVFILGDRAVCTITQPTKWRKRFQEKVEGEFPEGIKGYVEDPDPAIEEIAEKAAKAAGLDISGVDVMKVDDTGELLVIEANAAPAWNLVKKYTNRNIEREILEYLITL